MKAASAARLVLLACLSASCVKAAAEVAPLEVKAPAAHPAARRQRAICDGAPCRLSVELSGNREVPSDDLYALMSVLEEGVFEREKLERDLLALAAAYRDRGFLSVEIAPYALAWSGDRSALRITVSIREGRQFRVKSIEVYEDRAGLRCPPRWGWSTTLSPGDVFDRDELTASLTVLLRSYRDRGYAAVEAEPKTSIDSERGEVGLTIPVVRGALHVFGRIGFDGNHRIPAAELRRYLEVSEGARFSETALLRSRTRLLEGGLLEQVEVGAAPGKEAASIDVVFGVWERFPSPPEAWQALDRGEALRAVAEPPPASAPLAAPGGALARAADDSDDTQGCKPIPGAAESGARPVPLSHGQ